MNNDNVYFLGSLEKIIYSDKSSYFKILSVEVEETDSATYSKSFVIATGDFGEVIEGNRYKFFGELVNHPKYKTQLKVSRYDKAGFDRKGLISYFSSERFSGIGKKKAESIIELYQPKASNPGKIIKAILDNPNDLKKISGLSNLHRVAFLKRLESDYSKESTLSNLYGLGVPHSIALKLEHEYSDDAVNILSDDPYDLAEKIKGFSFRMADAVAENLGIKKDSPIRIQAGVNFTLKDFCDRTGDTYALKDVLVRESASLLQQARQVENILELIESALLKLIDLELIYHVGDKFFPRKLYRSEKSIAKSIGRILNNESKPKFSKEEIEEAIDEFEEDDGIVYDSIQRSAIIQSMMNPFFILTGGPGTGKTKVINGVVSVYKKLMGLEIDKDDSDSPIMIAAPTGRAARRASEMTGLYAATLHRHLGLPENYIEEDLSADFIIVDEFSMVDTSLAASFFKKVGKHSKLLIVGDSGQLPSVSPGNVLADLLKIEEIPSVTLEKVFRQSEESTIVTLASDIRKGIFSQDFQSKKPDRSFIEAKESAIPELVQKVISSAIRSGVEPKDIQILCPMYKGESGINKLNEVVQGLLNPNTNNSLEFKHYLHVYRKGDRVIQTENNLEAGVFNGDTGTIIDLIPALGSSSMENEIVVDFEGNIVSYSQADWGNITLAYAMSIHKSQGSEFPVVIMPLTYKARMMLQRNLIYTGITRSKSKLVFLGESAAFKYAVESRATNRNTYLVETINDVL